VIARILKPLTAKIAKKGREGRKEEAEAGGFPCCHSAEALRGAGFHPAGTFVSIAFGAGAA